MSCTSLVKFVTQGSYADVLRVGLSYDDCNTEELSDDVLLSSDVFFTMRKVYTIKADPPKIDDQPVTVLSSADGIVEVEYEWSEANDDLDTPGRYRGEFRIVVGGKNLYSPSPWSLGIIISPNQS